jgi:urocanate hydratase
MIRNNLDPEVAEDPDRLIVYGGAGRAARSWECFHAIVRALRSLENDETLIVQSGKPVGVSAPFQKRHGCSSPTRIWWVTGPIGNEFNRLERMGLAMFGQMKPPAHGSISAARASCREPMKPSPRWPRRHFGGSLAGKLVVSGGMGGMGGAQPLAATMNGAAFPGHRRRPETHRAPPASRLLRPHVVESG